MMPSAPSASSRRRLGRIVDHPEVDAQAEVVALRDERGAIEADRTRMDGDLRRGAGERKLPPQQCGQAEQRQHLALRQRGLAGVAPRAARRRRCPCGSSRASRERSRACARAARASAAIDFGPLRSTLIRTSGKASSTSSNVGTQMPCPAYGRDAVLGDVAPAHVEPARVGEVEIAPRIRRGRASAPRCHRATTIR